MRYSVCMVMAVVVALFLLVVGCGPPEVPPVEEIETNETAFLVPLEGESRDGQAQFMSIGYLNEAKVATKRITIPVRKRKIGRGWWKYEWLPTMRVIKVDRTPVTREWTRTGKRGTSSRNEAIAVESRDSISFSVGVNLTGLVTEENASTFLYYYAGKPLSEVIDQNVRGFVQSVLGREFGSRELARCKEDKKEIFDICFKETREHFLDKGVVIDNLGHAEGIAYDDGEIQKAINDAYTAEMAVARAEWRKQEQAELNELAVAKATADRKAAEEFAKAQEAMVAKVQLEIERIRAEADLERANKWNGALPANILPEGSPFLFSAETSLPKPD